MRIAAEIDPRPTWKERRKEELRGELIATALRMFEERGCEAPSVDEIAAGTGVAKGTFYLYFKTKAEIVRAIIEDGLDDLEARTASAIAASQEDASQALKAVIRRQTEFFGERRSMAALLLGGREPAQSQLPPEARAEVRDRCRAVMPQTYERLIRMAMLGRRYREVDARLAAQAIYGVLAELAYGVSQAGRPAGELAEAAMELVEKGLAA